MPAFLITLALASAASSRYDVVVLGNGIKESLLASLLASHGKSVLQLESADDSGSSLDLQQLHEITAGPDAPPLPEKKLGRPTDYSIERAPKLFLASGRQLQQLVGSGAWQHMDLKRVHRAFMYRQRDDGKPDVHRVLASSEDVVKTRTLAPLEKARVVQFFLWVDRYDEADSRTHTTSLLSKKTLQLHRMSAAKFLALWELPSLALTMVVRGMALHSTGTRDLKKLKASELVRRLKRYKQGYATFPHMTCPYIYPVGGFGASLARASRRILQANGGASSGADGARVAGLLTDGEGRCTGVSMADGEEILSDCVVAGPAAVPEHVAPRYDIVRLYAVLGHAPNLCKDAKSCQLLLPAEQCERTYDTYLTALSSTHGAAPSGKWVVAASTRVEGPTDGLTPLAVAKRELAAVLPLLKPSLKLFAEVTPYYEPAAPPEALLVLPSTDETSYFDSIERDVEEAFALITGEPSA